MASSEPLAGESVEDSDGKEAGAQDQHDKIEHGKLPRNTARKMTFSPYRFEREQLAGKYKCHIGGWMNLSSRALSLRER